MTLTATFIGDCSTIARDCADVQGAEWSALSPDLVGPLAQLYLDAYPPEIGAATLSEARSEMESTLAGAYGELLPDASICSWIDGQVAGSVQVVRRSIWDPDLDMPFVIELFVHPAWRGRGMGRALLVRAAGACLARRCGSFALRVGEGTSAPAHHLYHSLGMKQLH